MTRDWYKQNKHVFEAWAAGKDIEVFAGSGWRKISNICLWFEHELRIKPEIEYPIYARHKYDDVWVKFTGITTGEVIGVKCKKGVRQKAYVGEKHNSFMHHINENEWEIIPNPYELKDKDAVLVWDNENEVSKMLCFYDEKNDTVFDVFGNRDKTIPKFKYIQKILPWDMQDWIIKAQKQLKD